MLQPAQTERVLEQCHAIRASGRRAELESLIRRFDGKCRGLRIRGEPVFDPLGEIASRFGHTVATTHTAQERLLAEDEQRRVLDVIDELIAVIQPDDSLVYVNQRFRSYTGLGMNEVAKGKFRELAHHGDDIDALQQLRRVGLKGGIPFEGEVRFRRHDGQYRWHRIRYSPLCTDGGEIVRWYATGIDIHERHPAARRLQNENIAPREKIARSSMFEEIVGSSAPMQRVLIQVAKVAPSDSTVLILGETGTGKELVARAVHAQSRRSAKAFVRVNCGAIPASLIASELFGHEKGAFTGALHQRLGRVESADGGTLFLDEIGELSPETQVALLRVLQEREFERVGSNNPISVDVRVIAATNANLTERIAAGTFRRDLFYRLNVFPIQLPSLRERITDIPPLVEYFIARYSRMAGKRVSFVDHRALELFKAYDWPGNVRELQNVIERALLLCDDDTLSIEDSWLKSPDSMRLSSPRALPTVLLEHETEMIKRALAECGGRISGPSGAAAKLGLPRQTLASRIKVLGIRR